MPSRRTNALFAAAALAVAATVTAVASLSAAICCRSRSDKMAPAPMQYEPRTTVAQHPQPSLNKYRELP